MTRAWIKPCDQRHTNLVGNCQYFYGDDYRSLQYPSLEPHVRRDVVHGLLTTCRCQKRPEWLHTRFRGPVDRVSRNSSKAWRSSDLYSVWLVLILPFSLLTTVRLTIVRESNKTAIDCEVCQPYQPKGPLGKFFWSNVPEEVAIVSSSSDLAYWT
jgi:hypothetical protein